MRQISEFSFGHKHGRIRFSPVHIIPCSFLLAILTGTVLLLLPFSSACGESTDFMTALFTSTTSVCVTGLVVVDTYAHWSLFGKLVILALIQLGGLGIITVTSMLMLLAHRRFSLSDRTLIHDALNLDTRSGTLPFLRKVFKVTFIVEGAGACLYCFAFIPEYGVIKGIWISVFNAVSAFCNAGLDIIGPSSLSEYQSNPLVLSVTMALIIIGGLGYVVWFDMAKTVRNGAARRYTPVQIIKRMGEHTRLVLLLTLILIISGTAVVFFAEYNNPGTIGAMGIGDKLLNSLFEAVTFRTAGFSSIPQEKLTNVSCIAGYILMFIGGSPIGTAGGVKTVTMFIVAVNAVSFIRGRNETVIFKRRIPGELMRKSAAIVTVSFGTVTLLTLLLFATNNLAMADGIFEVISASGTVGLTRDVTPILNTAGRVIIVIAMYLGRVGPISMALFFTKPKQRKNSIEFSSGRFYVG